MDVLKYIFSGLICITTLVIFVLALKSRKFVSTLLINAVLGWGSIAIIDLTSKFTGVYIPINCWTVSVGGIFGTPGVVGLLLLNFIFI